MRRFIPSWIRVPVLFFSITGIIEYFVGSGDRPAFIEKQEVLLFLIFVLLIIIAIEAIVGSMENVLYQSLNEDEKVRFDAKRNETPGFIKWINKTYKKLVGGKPIEEEHEIILDHNYDGIKELDNSLPPWWLYGFYLTIIFGVVYMLRYHIFNGDNQYKELETEYAIAQKEIDAYKLIAKDLVDYNTVEVLTDISDLAAGKKIFETNCIACHKSDGGGGIGPNLTDQYWILGGGIKNVFKTISEGGRDGKGMVPWKKDLKPSEMAQVASYVLQFQGTTPAEPKAAEGEIWIDGAKQDAELEAQIEAETKAIVTDSITVEN